VTSLIIHQARYDLRVSFRDPRARGLTLGMPVLLLLLFGYIFRHDAETVNGHVLTGPAYYVPRMIVLGIASATLSSLVISIVARRESGALKRRRATPVRPSALIAGDVITSGTSALAIAVVVTVLGWVLFSVHLDAA
jgi:ABC-2 type transport system permease protein